MSQLVNIITAQDPDVRNQSLDAICRQATLGQLINECTALDTFRRESSNLYERVRALFFLYAIHRFHVPEKTDVIRKGLIPFEGYEHLLQRRFEEAIDTFLKLQQAEGVSEGTSSALAAAYHSLAFQTLADQVRRSVRSVRGNQWMFRIGHPADHPMRIRPEMLSTSDQGLYPILFEATPVRMDLSHSGWSDIFFLGMDFPEGARVLNVSIDLAVHGRDPEPKPPVEAYLRVLDTPVLRLSSVDLRATTEIQSLAEVFDYAKDYLGLLKAALIASGIIPPGMEGSGERLTDVLSRMVGPGKGLELVSKVNGIPKGSRLAVSTNLLACMIAVCMRATGQTKSLTGPLHEQERRLIAARAILGEWLAGSGGGWQDSGGVWPGMKLITGEQARNGDPEFGISRGRLLPGHHILSYDEVSEDTRNRLQDSLVLVHGGMAQDVGPILEMVTEKYLLRSEAEWSGRKDAMQLFDDIVDLLKQGNVEAIGDATTRNFYGPIQTIIPWAHNLYTQTLVQTMRERFDEDFWGFWMLGGMSGGGMGFIFAPERKREGQHALLQVMQDTKDALQNALPYAMDPVVYDFAINEKGTYAELLSGDDLEGIPALMPSGYYALTLPHWIRQERHVMSLSQRNEISLFGSASRNRPEYSGMVQVMFDQLVPRGEDNLAENTLSEMLRNLGFDRVQHEQIRRDLRNGRIGLAQNRMPTQTVIRDVNDDDVASYEMLYDADARISFSDHHERGMQALRNGEVAVVTLAAGVGSRWTHGAGVVKALHPFCKLGEKHRSFIEVHLAKSRRVGHMASKAVPHVITTSYLTHRATEDYLKSQDNYGYEGPLFLSHGRIVGLRMIPMARDLRFMWEEMPQQLLDEQAQKMQDSLRAALIGWATVSGEGSDYTDNVPTQCLHPVGHWYEIPNLFLNGTLTELLNLRPNLTTLMMHNIDTVGADLNPVLLGAHLAGGAVLSDEVITRRIEDRGGGLARVDETLRLIEGMALPNEEDEFKLSYYNCNTMWIDIDGLLSIFGLSRETLKDHELVTQAVREVAQRMPTYVTLKDVKKRWGHGQEDVFPVAQFEKLWGDMTAYPGLACNYMVVPRMRGQQLKEQAQLDGWLRDGSAAFVESLCEW